MSGTFLDTSEHADQFPDLLTVQQRTPGAQNDRGAPGPDVWADVEGLTDLPCLKYGDIGQIVPTVQGGAPDESISTHTILTKDYCPAIVTDFRGVIDGKVYEFLLCDHEGMKTVGVIKAKAIS